MIFSVETELEFLLRIVLSIICGAGIGFERETRLKTAGIRTHIDVYKRQRQHLPYFALQYQHQLHVPDIFFSEET